MKIVMKSIAATALSVSSLATVATERDYVVEVDTSNSSPIKEQAFAAAAANAAYASCSGLPYGSTVSIGTIGAYGRSQELLAPTELANRGSGKPEIVCGTLKKLIAGMPYLLENGKVQVATESNISGGLLRLKERRRQGRPLTLFVISDFHEEAREGKFKYKLVEPRGGELSGVEILTYGAGRGAIGEKEMRAYEALWQTWAAKAGASISWKVGA